MTQDEAVALLATELTRLDRAATPAPFYTLDPPWLPGGSETSILAGSPDPHVARFICDFDLWALDDDSDGDRKSECPDADAALLVWLRNHVPEILAALNTRTAPASPAELAQIEGNAFDVGFAQAFERTREAAAKAAETAAKYAVMSFSRIGEGNRLNAARVIGIETSDAIRALDLSTITASSTTEGDGE